MTTDQQRFAALLRHASQELYEDNPAAMSSPELVPSPNVIDDGDLELFFEGVDRRLIRLERGGKFNTFDRPIRGGHWSLLSRSTAGGWYNAEYLPQLAAYVDAVERLGFPKDRVFFELPPESLQLDLAILDDTGRVVVLAEAKRAVAMLDKLVAAMNERFATEAPTDESKKRGDEARQLAWRLWTVRPRYLWLIAPGQRLAFECEFDPLRLEGVGDLPNAAQLGLDARPLQPLRLPWYA